MEKSDFILRRNMKKDLRIFLTRFLWDDEDYAGPNIIAENQKQAELIAESMGCDIVGELTEQLIQESECKKIH